MIEKLIQFVSAFPRRLRRKTSILLQGRARCFEQAISLVEGKYGLEMGGPTDVFQGWRMPSPCFWRLAPLPIYDKIGLLDNCNFSDATIWGSHGWTYQFSPLRPLGKVIIAEGTNTGEATGTYDFVLSSHNLEHFANPVKALLEWKRITRPEGALILVLPHYKNTFDHRRTPTAVNHMFEDYMNNTTEEDTTHFEEVVRKHDLTLDGFLKTGTVEEFRTRCENNLINRSMHHHVFDQMNTRELVERVGLKLLALELSLPYHMIVLARWKP